VRQVQADAGERKDLLTQRSVRRSGALRHFERRRANEILEAASVFFWCAGMNRHGEGG
jgi:hypothetical protein